MHLAACGQFLHPRYRQRHGIGDRQQISIGTRRGARVAGLGALAIPGVGPVVAAGWLVATVTGAGLGAAAGGLLGALTGAGLSEAEAEAYAEGVRRGGTLVSARVEEDRADRALAVLDRHGSIDLDERADEADLRGDTDHAAYLRQEAAAWRATIVLLRQMAAAHEEAASVVVVGRGVA